MYYNKFFCQSIILLGVQGQGVAGVLFNGLVAEPPVNLVTVHVRRDLIGGAGVELAPGHPTGQHRQDFVRISQIRHHPQRCRDFDFKRLVEFVYPAVQGFAGAGCRMAAAAQPQPAGA